MRILLDENMPHNLVRTLRVEGHAVESVHTLGIAGVQNGDLYRIIRNEYDLLFTKDVGFNDWAKKIKEDHRVKYALVTLPQKSQDLFVKDFIAKFSKTDWSKHIHGNAWPKEIK
ncbi:MAG: hypothetical protein A3G87_09510 [Omnitrophica bacterium RIFCSPLOWO2_12_FULL_50_11]|nr:MAG: hypothetical protein A3G87_09510 [Omnitrophica bacterium RIFCSPLOWO2_12_FULL_50_11]